MAVLDAAIRVLVASSMAAFKHDPHVSVFFHADSFDNLKLAFLRLIAKFNFIIRSGRNNSTCNNCSAICE